ncbi:MAG: MBL fold metallo-hydrolase, partial [Anaerotignum sp.]|nr:MBL fold metallo-hydrolase [Anaerotignum sp.]
MMITNDIRYIGVNDHEIDMFEGQFVVPDGMAYNSYAILDKKIAIIDSVERKFTEEWMGKIGAALGGRKPDYLIVQHMEPDHSGNIEHFLQVYPEAVVVASVNAFRIMQNFFGRDFSDRRMVVKEGDTLNLGKHELKFLAAPMVHWPEVIMTYDAYDKVLFSADAFGKFGALDVEDEWECEARRYYFGIIGKYGPQVQAVLKKMAELEIQTIC